MKLKSLGKELKDALAKTLAVLSSLHHTVGHEQIVSLPATLIFAAQLFLPCCNRPNFQQVGMSNTIRHATKIKLLHPCPRYHTATKALHATQSIHIP